ncbi:MAG: VOC family protein [Rectinemataceae bacterium]
MARPIHFEFEADDPERAAKFYRDVFGWKAEKWGGPVEYWLFTTGPEGEPGIGGGMARRQGAPTGTINTIGVDDVDAAILKVLASGGVIVAPKHAIPGVGWIAYCRDTEGNAFGVEQDDPAAH